MLLSDAIKLRIKILMEKKHIKNVEQLANASGITKTTLYSYMNSTNSLPNLITLQHITEGLQISMRNFFNDALFDETEQD